MSQFKKPKGLMNRSPSPSPSNVQPPTQSRVPGSHVSNQSQNYVSELKRANAKNQNLLNSLLNDGLFDMPEDRPSEVRQSGLRDATPQPSSTNVPLIDDLSENPENNVPATDGQSQVPPQPDEQRRSKVADPVSEAPKETNYIRSDIARGGRTPRTGDAQSELESRRSGRQSPRNGAEIMLPALNNSFAKGPSLREQLAQAAREKQERAQLQQIQPDGEQPVPQEGVEAEPQLPPPPPPPEPVNFYKSNLEPVLLVVCLKKLAHKLQQDNTALQAKSLVCDKKEGAYIERIKKLENTLEDTQLRLRLNNKSTSDGVKLDLNDLAVRLKNIDQILDTATADNMQERFIEDIVAKNRDYGDKSAANSEALKALKDNLGRVKGTLLSISNL